MDPDFGPVSGFDQTFQTMQGMFWFVFVVVAGAMVFQVARGAARGIRNTASPEVSAVASIVDKRIATHGGRDTQIREEHFVTFQQSGGERFELGVPAREYGLLVVGDHGTVTMKGTRFVGFTRETLR